MRPLRALSLDLDETLCDGSIYRDVIASTCTAIATESPPLDAAELIEVNDAVWHDYWPEIDNDWVLGLVETTSVSREAWRRTLLACGSDDESLVQFAVQTHRQCYLASYRAFDDVDGLFASVQSHRIPLVLITNGASDVQRDKLRALDLEDHFDQVLISGEVGVAKPDAALFDMAVDRLSVEPGHVWHVGDNLRSDVGGGKAAGLTTVWLNRAGEARPHDEPEPDLEVRALSDLVALLKG